MTKKIQMMSHDKEWQVVNGVETLVPVEQFDIDPVTDSSCVKIEGFRTLEETLNEKNMFTPEVNTTKVMDRVGGEYHQNVVDGAYEEAILYGNSKVNLMEDDTETALPIPQSFTSFGNGLRQETGLGNNSIAPMLKGVTRVNLAETTSVTISSGNGAVIRNVKGGTVYTVSFKFTTPNRDRGITIQSYDANGAFIENTISKTNLGADVKFTFTTHSNATKIHICNNPSYGGETIKLDDIMVIEGDQTLMNLTFFKGMRSVELVKPLTNLFRDDLGVKVNNTTVTNSGGTVTVTSSSSSAWSAVNYYLNTSLKPNTKYLVMWDSVTKTHTSTANPEALISVYNSSDNTRLGYINNDTLCPTQRSLIFDTGNINPSNIVIRIHATMSNTETGTTTVKGLRVFEWDDVTTRALDLQSIGYFSGTKNVSIPNFKTNSKNLYPYGDINFTSEFASMWCDAKGNAYMTGDIASKSKSRFLLRKGTYCYSHGGATNVSGLQIVDDKENLLSNPITLTQDTYCTLRVKTIEANVATTVANIQIERGSTETSYVSYDTRQYKPDNQEVVVLRSLPNGVCDTFNLQTGEYVQRIGEITIDGSGARDNIIDGAYARLVIPSDKTTNVYANEIGFYCSRAFALKNNGATLNNYGIYENPANFVLFDKTVSSAEEFAIKYNGVTIQYQLAEPIIKQIPTVNNIYNTSSRVDFREGKNANFRCFGNPTYLEVGSLSPVNPIVEPIINVPLNARLKANTSYTVRLDRTGSSLNVDLGGTTVSTSNSTDNEFIIKTPTGMLSHNQIRFSGNGSVGRVMVFEGDIRGIELPYFMGINNVKMPIVRNCGKNLFNMNDVREADTWKSDIQIGSDKIYNVCKSASGGGFGAKIKVKLKPNTQYYIGWEGQSINVYIYWNSDVWGTQGSVIVDRNTTFTTPGNIKYVTIGLNYLSNGCAVGTFISTINPILVEAGNDTSFEPYRGNDICLVQGEIGLSQDMFEQGGITSYPMTAGSSATYESIKGANGTRLRSKDLFKINGGKKYRISFLDDSRRYQWYLWDASGRSLGITGGWSTEANNAQQIIDVPEEAKYMTLMFRNTNSSNITVENLKIDNFQLLELDSTVQLRSLPNGVKDELNLLTGEYIQRVGEIVFDGSDLYNIEANTLNETHVRFVIHCLDYEIGYQKPMLCDVFPTDGDTQTRRTIFTYRDGFVVCIEREKLVYVSTDGFKQYLQSNPITVQYELAEPIISYPRIVSNTQEREVGIKLPNGICDTYNPSTGVTVKRVGFIEFDGSEDWHEPFATPTSGAVDMYNIWTEQPLNNAKPAPASERIPGVCDSLKFKNSALDLTNEEFYFISPTGRFNMNLSRSKLSEPTEQALKTYLSQNPIKLWYELKNPIVTTDIVLPNGVHDEYNPITGLYTKRVGFIEFDGNNSESWTTAVGDANPTTYCAWTSEPISDAKVAVHENERCLPICDKMKSYNGALGGNDFEFCYISHTGRFNMNINRSKLSEPSEQSLKTYLSQNPMKVWYELATPQKIQLTPYFGLPMPYAYQDGHLIMDSAYDGVSLPPEFKYRLIANRTGQVNQNNIKLQQHTTRLSNLEAMLVDATLQSMYEREMMAFNLEMVNINLINLEE